MIADIIDTIADRWKKLADQYAVTKLPEPNSWFCPGGCDCSCCYGYPDKDCHCFTYPCNCGGDFEDHHHAKEADQ